MTESKTKTAAAWSLSFLHRPGAPGPENQGDLLILVPGLGCPKECFNGAFEHEALRHTTLVTFDFPGQGDNAPARSPEPVWSGNMQFLCRWLGSIYMLTGPTGRRVHMVAHSMGNLPALAAWAPIPQQHRGAFIAIEGNLTTADCFASSRLSIGLSEAEAFIDELRDSPDRALKRWGDDLMWNEPKYLVALARDLVSICGTDYLTNQWDQLADAHYFYGERSGYPEHHRDLFERTGTNVREIPASGHFPMFDNSKATWDEVADAVRGTHA